MSGHGPTPRHLPGSIASRRTLTRMLRDVNERLVISGIREQEHADASEHQRAELRALLEALGEGVVIASAAGEIVMTNRAALAILGLHSASGAAVLESADAHGPALFGVDDAALPSEHRPLRRALRGESFDDCPMVVRHVDGRKRHLMASGTSIGEGEHPSLAIVVLRDVTDVWRLEQQREEYLALISHDLRGPITAIRLLARSLREPIDPDELVDRVDRIEKNATRMEAMIQQLLDATSLEQHATGTERTPCDLAAVVADVAASLDEERRARVVVEAARVRGEVLADVPSLTRAISNLIANALKYSAGAVDVRVAEREGFGVIDVVDHGSGIAARDVTMLFDRYFRASTVSHGGGLGLGLYIVRLVAEAHGGRVTVDTKLGEGSTFSLLLPLRRAA